MSVSRPGEKELKGGAVAVRSAQKSDIPAVGLIERDSFGDPWGSREFATALNSPHTIFLIGEEASMGEDGSTAARVSRKLVGYAIAQCVADESEILNLAVQREHRGQGIGGSLLDAALAEALSRGAAQVWLEVRESNRSARKLYQSRGFDEVSRRHGYYRNPVEDALVLRLAL